MRVHTGLECDFRRITERCQGPRRYVSLNRCRDITNVLCIVSLCLVDCAVADEHRILPIFLQFYILAFTYTCNFAFTNNIFTTIIHCCFVLILYINQKIFSNILTVLFHV